jgi:hypothetical protein
MKQFSLLLAIGLCALAFTALPLTRAVAQQPGVVTDANLNQMIKNAKTPSDHEAIAEYYDKEAAENENKAKLHQISESVYFKTSNRLHCGGLIKAYKAAARQDKALAAAHRQMARAAVSR